MIISIETIKGGVGKTTTAIALASVAAAKGRDVLVLDADPQGSSCLWAALAEDAGEPLPFDVNPANGTTIKRVKADPSTWVIIDVAPSGKIVDDALEVADFVIIPSGSTNMDFQQTWLTAQTASEKGKNYAILLNKARSGTLALAAAKEALNEQEASCFDTVIPLREALGGMFGRRFGSEFFGFEGVYEEIVLFEREISER